MDGIWGDALLLSIVVLDVDATQTTTSEDSSIQKSYTTISGIDTSSMTITPRDTSLSAWKLYGQLKSGVAGLLHFFLP